MLLNQLDLLPVELIHKIFTYLSAHEIFYGFSNLTDYLDATLISYNRYIVDFHSILKSHFDITCCCLRPYQVISLTLSDDDETLNQSELFFSRFNIEQFNNLRSFDMSLMNDNTCKKLIHLDKLKYLSSLKLPRLFQPYCEDFNIAIQKLFPQLNRFMAYNTQFLPDDPLPNLHHLILKYCNIYYVSTLFKLMPNLHSLDIMLTVSYNLDWPYGTPVMINLKKLVFSSYGEKLTIIKIKEFLSKMPNLKYFELDTEGSFDLLDGQQWESIVSSLITFDFRIQYLGQPLNSSDENILESFRSLFWLEHKRWFVACDGPNLRHIFTIPRFAPMTVTYPYINWPPICTSSDFSFDQYIKTLRISSLDSIPYCFTNIRSVVVDTNEISSDIGIMEFVYFVQHMQFLHSISFRDLSVLDHLPKDIIFEKIRSLDVRISVRTIDRLCTVFPRLERLNIKLATHDNLVLIDRLQYLSIAKFEFDQSLTFVPCSSLIRKSRCLQANNNFTLTVINHSIHLWINKDKVSNNNRMFKWSLPFECNLQ